MIDYYTAKELGGNTRKISIMLAETGLEHVVHFLDLAAGVQRRDWYLDINPNGRIPAIVDHDVVGGYRLGESGAILIYLAEKTGQFLPRTEPERSRAIQWVFWQVGHVGPMFGQLSYFARSAPERIEFAIERYRQESLRIASSPRMSTSLANTPSPTWRSFPGSNPSMRGSRKCRGLTLVISRAGSMQWGHDRQSRLQ